MKYKFSQGPNMTFKSSFGLDGAYIRDRIYTPEYTLNRKGGEPYVEDREQLERKMTYSTMKLHHSPTPQKDS